MESTFLSSSGTKWMWFIKFRHFLLMWLKKLYWYFDLRKILILSTVVFIATLAILPLVTLKSVRIDWLPYNLFKNHKTDKFGSGYLPCQVHPSAHIPTRFNQDNSGLPPFNQEIIPNTIHFYRTGKDVNSINFIDALCLYSAFRIVYPEKIMIHTDDVLAVTDSFTKSPYGKRLMQVPGFQRILDVQYWPIPKHVFGIEFNSIYRSSHMNDVTRLRILRKHGGIFLDKHAFLLKNPNHLRYYEMVVFENKGHLSNHLIIAHRDSRMLDLWLKSYHKYDPDIKLHHHTPTVESLFMKKSTFYHKLVHGEQDGSINVSNSENVFQIKDHNDCYVLYLNTSKLMDIGSENYNLEFESDSVVNFVEKYLSNIKLLK